MVCGDGVNETPIASIWRCEGASPNPVVGAANELILRSKVAFVHEGCLLVFESLVELSFKKEMTRQEEILDLLEASPSEDIFNKHSQLEEAERWLTGMEVKAQICATFLYTRGARIFAKPCVRV